MSPPDSPIDSARNGLQGHILLAEDDVALQQNLADALRAGGFRVTVSADARSVRAQLAEKVFTHIVIDVRLPDANGIDLLPHCRRCQPRARIVMISGYASLAGVVLALRAGASDFLDKPFATSQLLASLMLRQPAPPRIPETPMSPERLRWERIHRTFEQCGRNTSHTARLLGLHRQTVARALASPPANRLAVEHSGTGQ